ncbi:hypothetical protein IQ266_04540 [filamentous cyanobacterium LEGE 11480]|uniref:C2 domain-containing protein n=1 Tax=Romeriopsis navalis LEGE 11480 TaxID=2777977 RepID=A0A928Z203_9CYAN|nr:hypothetical protein [Romeriopsis navalis]MBE9029029.1 hypothetical protein [Romeriopsis navalis LEGE 11480]
MKRPLAHLAWASVACLSMLANPLSASAQRAPEPEDRNPSRRSEQVTLTVIKAKALTKFDRKIRFTKRHRPDFYLITRASGHRGRTRRKNNQDNPTFNHKVVVKPTKSSSGLVFNIQLLDSDIGKDDQADISPDRRKRDLSVVYTFRTGKISLFGQRQPVLGRVGEVITVKGDAKKNRASLTFKINHTGR